MGKLLGGNAVYAGLSNMQIWVGIEKIPISTQTFYVLY